jgi:hypothetical protein
VTAHAAASLTASTKSESRAAPLPARVPNSIAKRRTVGLSPWRKVRSASE